MQLSTAAVARLGSLVALAGLASGAALPNVANPESEALYVPAPNPNIDRRSITHLSPTWRPILHAREPSGRLLSTSFNMTHPAIVLEDAAVIRQYTCSEVVDAVRVEFESEDALALAMQWPSQDLVLITHAASCNPADERGVYLTHGSDYDSTALTATFSVKPKEWKEVATTMQIDFTGETKFGFQESILASELKKRSTETTALTCTTPKPKGSTCGVRGNLNSARNLSWREPANTLALCRNACWNTPTCKGFSFYQGVCLTSPFTSTTEGFVASSQGSYVWWDRSCFACQASTSTATHSTASSSTKQSSSATDTRVPPSVAHTVGITKSQSTTTPPASSTASGLGFQVTAPTSLDAAQLVIYSSITSGISYNSDGAIVGNLGTLGTSSMTIAQPNLSSNPASQSSALSQLVGDNLPSFDDAFAAAQSALSAAFSAQPTASSAAGGSDAVHARAAAPLPVHPARQTAAVSHPQLLKRSYSFGDFLDDVDTYGCNDFVTTLSETAEDVCDGIDGAEAIYCIATACYQESQGQTPPPPSTLYTYDYTWSVDFGGWVDAAVIYYNDNGSVLGCPNCNLNIFSSSFSGSIEVVLSTTQISSCTVTVTENSAANLIMEITTLGADSDNWSQILYTEPLQSFTQTGVFTISPQIIMGLGAQWNTDSAIAFTAGASMNLNSATSTLDLVSSLAGNANNWQPSSDITYPTSQGAATYSFTPFIMSSIELSVQVFGNQLNNLAAITSQTNLGFASTMVNFGNAANAHCPAGQLQSSTFMTSVNAVSFNGNQSPLYNNNQAFPPSCSPVSVASVSPAQVSSLAADPNGPAFCTSYINYHPPVSTFTTTKTKVTLKTTVTKVAPTVTVTEPVAVVTSVVYATPPSKRDNIEMAAEGAAVPAAVIEARAAPTPSLLSTWYPQQVSAACSEIATGTTSTTVTVTSTTSKGRRTTTVTPHVTLPQQTTTDVITVTGPTQTPTNVVQNPLFNSSNPEYYNEDQAPPDWNFQGYIWESDCTSPYSFEDDDFCYGYFEGMSFLYTLLSEDQYINASYAVVSQTLTGLEPGWTYRFSINAGFDDSANTCIVTYALDDYTIAQFAPTNTYNSDNNEIYMPQSGPFNVVPTATSQVLSFGMNCPNAGDNGGVSFWTNATFWGPYIS